jgi:WD40 repeat protein
VKVSQPRRGAFISYARADGESAARALHARLGVDAPDIPAWLDRFDIEGGIGWWNQIEQELERAEFLLLVITPAAVRSENTRNEWRSARQRGVCVYPVKGVPDPQLDYASLPNWMRKVHFYDPEVEWEKLLAHLRRGCRVTRVTFMAPPLPASFVARAQQSAEVLALLGSADGHDPAGVAVTLRGPGGFGKTTLASALCHDDRILDAFDDGILWVTLGQDPNLLNELVKLYAALTGDRPGFVDVEDATRAGAQLEGKNCLMVIDDVWKPSDLRPFLQGGSGCARLITTRRFDLAADARRVDVDRMSAAEALALLLARAGTTPTDTEPCERLIERLGEWPLPITLAGSAMRQRIERGDTIAGAVAYVNRALDKRGIAAFDLQPTAAREDAVVRTVGASFDLLGPDDQRRCVELAIFQPGAAHPLSAVATLWRLDDIDTEDLVRRLDDLALVTFDLRRATVRMHDVLRGFFGERLADAVAVHERLLDGWGDPFALADGYVWRAFAYHMRCAGRQAALRALLLDPRWLDAKLRATDIHALIVDFEHAEGDRVLGLLRDALRLAAPSLAGDPAQLRTQVIGRLQLRDEPDFVALRAAMRDAGAGPWLELLHPTLDAPGGLLFMTLVGHNAAVTSLAVDGDWRWLLSGSNDQTIRVWDTRDGQLIRILDHADAALPRSVRAEVWELAVTHDGRLALAGAADGFIYVWDVDRGTQQRRRFSREAGRAISAVALSGDGRIAMSAARDTTVRVWDVPARVLACALSGHSDEVTSVAISAAGTRAASASEDATVRLWNVSTGALERTLEGHTAGVNAVALSADGGYVLSGSSDRTVKLWDAGTGRCVQTLSKLDATVTSVALAAAGWRALVGTSDRSVTLWDLHDAHLLARLDGHSDSVTAVCIDDAGIRAATCASDTTVKLWQLDDLRASRSTDADAGVVQVVVFSPDGRLCASASDDGPVTIREVESGRVVRRINATPAPARGLAFTADSSCILSAGNGHYWLWRIDTGDGTWIPVRHAAPVDCSALSAVARYLTTSCTDRFVYIWDVPSGALIDRFGTRRLFAHVIAATPKRLALPDTEEYRDIYLPGESVYDILSAR